MKNYTATLTAFLAILPCGAAMACATCGCSLSSDAAMGYSSSTGWQVGLEYTYINQDQLRNGTSATSQSQVATIPDQEVEDKTTNRYLTLNVGYSPSANWNFRALIPYIDRSHTTYGQNPTLPLTSDQISGANVSSLGDMKFIVSYQGFLPTHNLGFQLGVKLPTGNYGGTDINGNTVGRNPVSFNSGPNAGSPLDTSLQAGTGSTDLIVGAYYYQPVSQDFDAFVSGQFQSAVAQRLDQAGADYRPGNLGTLTFGLRYEANPSIVPQVQVNITRKSKDGGFLADVPNSAGTVAYLSPGVTVAVGGNTHLYGFVQLPVHSNLDGYQLFPHWTATLGLSHAF